MGHFRAAMQKWGIVDSAQCECGDQLQTVEHIITTCPKHQQPSGERSLIDLDDRTLDWLASTELKLEGHTAEEKRRGYVTQPSLSHEPTS